MMGHLNQASLNQNLRGSPKKTPLDQIKSTMSMSRYASQMIPREALMRPTTDMVQRDLS